MISNSQKSLQLREDFSYSILVLTSMGVRLTPVDRQPVFTARQYDLQVTSAESNVASVCSYLGLPAKVLTALVSNSPIAKTIKYDLMGRGITVEAKEVRQDGPWGLRHQINIADVGEGLRGPKVHNDRAGEAGRTLAPGDFDLERIFGQEGVQIVHLSGLIAALSPTTSQLCLEIARTAAKYGTIVSFDLNHRASFWKGREQELSEIFKEIAGLSQILIGNEEDFQLCLGISGPPAGGKDLGAKIDGFKGMIEQAAKSYPNTRLFATTLREVRSANLHLWGAIMRYNGEWFVEEPREIGVLDRIGGGDAFVGGLLYAILKDLPVEKWVQFGWASGAATVTLNTDYNRPYDEDEIWSIYRGNARVKR